MREMWVQWVASALRPPLRTPAPSPSFIHTHKVIHGYLVRAKLLSTLQIHSHVTKTVRLERFRTKPFAGMARGC